ncbi:MAG: TIGR00730 family Rossman fold protein [Candidatus Puniceispirillales bacterium]
MNICVFSGSSVATSPELLAMAERVGAMIAARHMGMIYGGGSTGMMGASASGAMSHGGTVHGIIPRFLQNLEVVNEDISRLTVTENMHQRKQMMYEEADAFIVLPGGFGTMEEMIEVLTWCQLKVINKPIFIFNPYGYWDHMLAMFDHAAATGFIRPQHKSLVQALASLNDIADALDQLIADLNNTENPISNL